MRAYAVETMFCSIDEEDGAQLFKIDPAGHFYGFRVSFIVLGTKNRQQLLELKNKRLLIIWKKE